MSPDELLKAAQDAATQVRAEMEQPPQLSVSLEMVREALTLAALQEFRAQQRGQKLLVIAAQMAEQRAAQAEPQTGEANQPPTEASMLPADRPPGGVIVHESPAPGESAQEKAAAEFAAAEAQRAAQRDESSPVEPGD